MAPLLNTSTEPQKKIGTIILFVLISPMSDVKLPYYMENIPDTLMKISLADQAIIQCN